MKEILVIIPAYNEEENISQVIEELRSDMDDADILIINDSSKDNTLKIVEQLGIEVITTPFNLGYAAVVQTGFKYAALKGYKYVAQFDGDGQHVASELKKLYIKMKDTDTDIVLGSRFKEKTDYNHALFRKIGTWMFQRIIKWSSGKEITDPTSGMQVLNEKVYKKYACMNNYPDYPDANLITEMLLQGYQVEEVSVQMRERTAGVSMHAGVWKPFKYMIGMFYSILIILIKYRKNKPNTMMRGAEMIG